jgi:hypothetical protein
MYFAKYIIYLYSCYNGAKEIFCHIQYSIHFSVKRQKNTKVTEKYKKNDRKNTKINKTSAGKGTKI